MTRSQKYQEFLLSPFWNGLSNRKKQMVGCCEECGSTKCLQSHHVEYPANWYDTTLEQLKVLCRGCHAKVHGKSAYQGRFMLHRNDKRFSRAIGRVDEFTYRIGQEGYVLSGRDLRFLALVEKKYPATPTDSCMRFHVQNCRRLNELMKLDRQGEII